MHDQVAVLLPGQAPPELGEAQVVTDAHADAPAAAREHARALAPREAVRDFRTLAHITKMHLVVDELDAGGSDDGLGDGEDRCPEVAQEVRLYPSAGGELHVGGRGDGVDARHDAIVSSVYGH